MYYKMSLDEEWMNFQNAESINSIIDNTHHKKKLCQIILVIFLNVVISIFPLKLK